MRKIAIIISLFILMTVNSAAFAKQGDQMTDLASIVSNHNMPIDHWKVTIKEERDDDKIENITEKLYADDSYKVSVTEDENTVKYFFERAQKNASISESYNVVMPKNPMYKAELVVVLQGVNWNDLIVEEYIKRMDDIQSTYFTHASTKFACLMTNIDAKIEEAYFFNKMKQTLQLTNIKLQTDNVENSMVKKIVYGYTPLWKQQILVEEPMNFQMVVQNDTHGGTRLTIGTPILINEY